MLLLSRGSLFVARGLAAAAAAGSALGSVALHCRPIVASPLVLVSNVGAVIVVATVAVAAAAVVPRAVLELDDLAVLGLEVEREVAPLPSQPAELALQGSPKVLDLVALVNRQEVAAHLRVLRLGPPLPPTPAELGSLARARGGGRGVARTAKIPISNE